MAVNFSAALPPARTTGDSGPAADMNLVRAALIELRTAVTNLAGGTVVDTTAPTISSFTATPGSTTAALAWGAVDDVAVTNCTITRGGTIRYQGNARTFTDTGLTNGTPYSWTLTVYDAAGNTRTATATVTPTAGATPADTTAPTVPTGLAVLQVTSTTANLAWAASTDSSGVATYDVYVNGSKVASAPGGANPFYVVTGLSPSTAYSFRVAAVDTAGNTSGLSTAAPATTSASASATPATALATETWTGSDGAAWPSQWSTAVASGGIVNISSNRGRLSSRATAYSAGNKAYLTGVSTRDVDLLGDITFADITEQYFTLAVRAANTAVDVQPEGYHLNIYPGNGTSSMGVTRGPDEAVTVNGGDFAGGSWAAGTPRRVRFQAVNNASGTTDLRVKVWDPTVTEPSSWTWTGSDDSANTTAVGSVWLAHGAGASDTARTVYLDNLTVTVPAGGSASTGGTGGAGGSGGTGGTGTTGGTSSGTAVPTGDLTGWKLVMSQDFTTDAALGQFATKYPDWAGYDGGTDTSGNGTYDSSKVVSVSNSILTKNLHTTNGVHYVAALTVPLINNTAWTGQTHGRYAVRFKADHIPGYKLAWLQWPLSDDWTDGEIDFPEADFDAGSTIGGFSHDTTGDPSSNAWAMDTGVTMDDWHICVVEWKPGSLTYSIDGVAQTTTTAAAIPTKGMRWCLQTETSLDTEPADNVTGNVYIDWIAAWSYTP